MQKKYRLKSNSYKNNMEELQQHWHALTEQEIFKLLDTSNEGLTQQAAVSRLEKYGNNQLRTYKAENPLIRFLLQMHNILIYILLASAVITIALQEWVDTSVILGVVIINAIVGFIQEGKAEKALAAIRDMLAPTAIVLRDGIQKHIPATELVPGDIVLIKSGDKIPADLRLIETKNLQVQEAILTGESLPVEKNCELLPAKTQLHDRTSLAYSGTIVVNGRGKGVVIGTGYATEVGKISTLLAKVPRITTPLLEQMDRFGYWLSFGIVLLAASTFIVGVFFWKQNITSMLMAAVGLTVAAIPEGLPPILTIILAIGVKRMAQLNAIVRKLPIVETMGAVTTICTDKTGTLTRNELAVQSIITQQHHYQVNNSNSLAEFLLANNSINLKEHHDLELALRAATLCNDAEQSHDHILGNPLDVALLNLSLKAKIDLALLQKSFPRTDLIPYESQHKFMATLHHDHMGNTFFYIKGAPENILTNCIWQQKNGSKEPIDIVYWTEQINLLAQQGVRVIALAYAEKTKEPNVLSFADINNNCTLVALFGLLDPPRQETAQAVAECLTAGINVKMITGDHPVTAINIASKVGLDVTHGVLTGQELDAMDENAFNQAVTKVNIYARTLPEHKLRLVRALQNSGQVVAMTGDGVNDAPALRQANIGIAMGQKGAEIAKEAAAMVLADDNFATIVNAVHSGRTIYDNLKKAILFILPTNMAEAFVIVVAILLGMQLPITAVQIMWVNMVTAVTLALALGFETAESDIMLRPPRAAKEPILSLFLCWRVVFVSLLLVTAVFILFILEQAWGYSLVTCQTIAVNTIVMGEIFYLINCRRIYNSVLSIEGIFGSLPVLITIALALIIQLAFTYIPFMQHFFGTAPLGIRHWLQIIAAGIVVFLLVEGEKIIGKKLANSI